MSEYNNLLEFVNSRPHGLSVTSIFEKAVDVEDWDELKGPDREGWHVVTPPITLAVLKQYDRVPEFDEEDALGDIIPDAVFEDTLKEIAAANEVDEDEIVDWLVEDGRWKTLLPEDQRSKVEEALAQAKDDFFDADDEDSGLSQAIEDFDGSRDHREWLESFEPAMGYYWPVELAYGVSEEEAAARIDKWGGNCSLIWVESANTHAIALTGGGMDLSWDICWSYLCCGVLPPVRRLDDLPLFGGERGDGNHRHLAIVEVAIPEVIEHLQRKANRLAEEQKRIRGYYFAVPEGTEG